MKYYLDSDDDGHWYVVEWDKRYEFSNWVSLDSDNEESWTPPKFAIPIDSPSSISFDNYIEND